MPMPSQVSSSAPPMFRAKKKKPGESNPAPQNNGRMTGPPMQQGAGQGSMFANGRMGQGQGSAPPSPDYPQAGRMVPKGYSRQGLPPAQLNSISVRPGTWNPGAFAAFTSVSQRASCSPG